MTTGPTTGNHEAADDNRGRCTACGGDLLTPWQAGGGHEQYCPNDPSQYEMVTRELHAALDRMEAIIAAGNVLAAIAEHSDPSGICERPTCDDCDAIDRWRELVGDG